ncbi:MAG TPA: FmdB family zinc ribbon protein [Pseudonocardiaceae bacterium]|nr:FmdB family zinc ribbon protein [Pseudonocardiaceae bacterium]
MTARGATVPTYQYACTACGHRFDAVQSFSDDALTECPECSGKLRKLFGSVGVVFKGSGFYRTDSRAESNGKVKAGSSSSDGAGKSDSTTSSDSSNSSNSKSSESSTSSSGSSGSSGSSSSSSTSSSGSSSSGSSGSSSGATKAAP